MYRGGAAKAMKLLYTPTLFQGVIYMICLICGQPVKQVSSATPELAMFQHLLWIHGILVKESL